MLVEEVNYMLKGLVETSTCKNAKGVETLNF